MAKKEPLYPHVPPRQRPRARKEPQCLPPSVTKIGLWEKIDTRGGYVFWRMLEGQHGKLVSYRYQVTKGEKPQGTGGYADLDYLYRIKGLKR
jgi:hypothetical protein